MALDFWVTCDPVIIEYYSVWLIPQNTVKLLILGHFFFKDHWNTARSLHLLFLLVRILQKKIKILILLNCAEIRLLALNHPWEILKTSGDNQRGIKLNVLYKLIQTLPLHEVHDVYPPQVILTSFFTQTENHRREPRHMITLRPQNMQMTQSFLLNFLHWLSLKVTSSNKQATLCKHSHKHIGVKTTRWWEFAKVLRVFFL